MIILGHEKGDEALKLCYQCISQAFQNVKNCFRIGGDEFAYVYHSDEKDMIPETAEGAGADFEKNSGNEQAGVSIQHVSRICLLSA